MCCKIKFSSDKYAAIITHIRLFTGMNHLMLYKIGFVSEGFVTDGTTKRFLPGVHINMLLEMIIRPKRLPALLAYVLFALVLKYMFIEILLVSQPLVAYMTLVFASIVFVLLMRGQSLIIRVNLDANIATHRLLFLVYETYVCC